MRRLVSIAVALSGVASAAMAERVPARTWADVVGEYTGKLAWSNCTAPGAKTATIALDVVDGDPQIDLTPAKGGLHAMSLIETHERWSISEGDLGVLVRLDKKNAIELDVDYKSGCRLRAQLARGSTGVAACDRMLAWRRVESRCTKLAPEDRVGIPDKRTWRRADAKQCTTLGDRLELVLAAAGCAPHPEHQAHQRSVACRELFMASDRLQRCNRVPPSIAAYATGMVSSLAGASPSVTAGEVSIIEQQCRDAHAEVTAIAAKFGCP